jgi:hypothetical protein
MISHKSRCAYLQGLICEQAVLHTGKFMPHETRKGVAVGINSSLPCIVVEQICHFKINFAMK